MKPSELIAFKNNSRKHDAEQIERIKKSIVEFGFINPVLIDEDNTIIAGHARVQSAVALSLKEVPTIRVSHLSENQIKAYVIADNRLAELSTWDNEMLGFELNAIGDSLDVSFLDIDLSIGDARIYNDIEEFNEINDEELLHECPRCGYQFD